MHSEGDSRTSRREKIRREAACHQLLEQWNMCQKELKRITQDLMGQLAPLRVLRVVRIAKAAQDFQVAYLVCSAILCPRQAPQNMA